MPNSAAHAISILSREPVAAIAAPMDDTLLTRFNAHFQAVTADTPEHVRCAQKIRYQVYCVENPHEKSSNPDEIETDEFDSHSAQSLLLYRPNGAALGTTRLILPLAGDPVHSFSVQRVMGADALRELGKLPHNATAEVSRFSISRQFRHMADAVLGSEQPAFVANSGPLIRLGLIQALVRMSVQERMTHWCALMEPTLLRMLSAMAIRFQPIGPLVEFRGLRQPCQCKIADVLAAVRRERPAFWSVITDNGALWPA